MKVVDLTYPTYLYEEKASRSSVLMCVCMAVTYRVARITKISSTSHTRAELACIPSASGVNLGHEREAWLAFPGPEILFSEYTYLVTVT